MREGYGAGGARGRRVPPARHPRLGAGPAGTDTDEDGMRERTDGTGFATRAIHAGERPDPTTHAHNTPIYRDRHVRVRHRRREGGRGRPGARVGPDVVLLLADRQPDEPGARGEGRVARGRRGLRRRPRRAWRPWRSTLFAHLDAGDHIVVGDELFAITRVLWEDDLPRRDIAVSTADMCDLAAVEAAIRPDHEDPAHGDVDEPAPADAGPRRRSPRWPTATGSWSSPTTRSSARRCSGPSSTARTSSCTPPRSTCPATATR